jgi:hypothetical protein
MKKAMKPKKKGLVHKTREHLTLAHRHVVEADERVARQWRRVELLRQAGRDTGASEDFPRLFVQTRKLMLAHQKLLEREMVETKTTELAVRKWSSCTH